MLVRRMEDADLDEVLVLNQDAGEGVMSLDAEKLRRLLSYAEQAVVAADADGTLTGFAFTIPPGTVYESANYRWFSDQFDDFAYLDRVVVGAPYRRRGIASMLYNVLEERARPHGRLVLEVFTDPLNEASLAFHHSRAYGEVGRLTQSDQTKALMLAKDLDPLGT